MNSQTFSSVFRSELCAGHLRSNVLLSKEILGLHCSANSCIMMLKKFIFCLIPVDVIDDFQINFLEAKRHYMWHSFFDHIARVCLRR